MMKTISLFLLIIASSSVQSARLVSPETIKAQKAETKIFRLKNHIPVVHRRIQNSDLTEIDVSFRYGVKDQPASQKDDVGLLFSTMAKASKKFDKAQVFRRIEKYALSFGCSAGIEESGCNLGLVNDFWTEGLELLASVISDPLLSEEDIKLAKDRAVANLNSTIANPSRMVNDVVNQVFYGKEHPYYQTFADSLKEVPKISRKRLRMLHTKILSANNMIITVASAMSEKELLKQLNKYFGAIKSKKVATRKVPAPKFVKGRTYKFENREIPTAYIRIKFNSTPATDESLVATKLMVRVLADKMWEEIRTKRSLSYAAYSFSVDFSAGIGVIGASTSKPKETLEAIDGLVKDLKSKAFTTKELDEYKTVYATDYFLTNESHGSLVSALSTTYLYNNNVERFYDLPRALDKVTPRDIQRLAQKLLVNFRIGVVYDKKKFKEEWAKSLVGKHLAK